MQGKRQRLKIVEIELNPIRQPNGTPGKLMEPALVTKQDLIRCLARALVIVEARLRSQHPAWIAQRAREATEDVALLAICRGVAERMTSAARWRWLWVVAHRQVVNVLRRKRPCKPLASTVVAPELRLFDHNDLARLHAALLQLHPSDRALVTHLYFDEMTVREAAAHLGLSTTTLIRRRDAALSQLRLLVLRLESSS